MNAMAKLIIGILVTLAGLAWYIWGGVFTPYIGVDSLTALGVIFVGAFGAFLVLIGLLITWIELEELKDVKAERKEKAEKEEEKPKPARRKR